MGYNYTPFSYNYLTNTQAQLDDKLTQSVLQDLAGINLVKQIPQNTLQQTQTQNPNNAIQNQSQAQSIDTSNGIKATQIQNQNQNATSLKDISSLMPSNHDKNPKDIATRQTTHSPFYTTNQNQSQAQRYVGNGVHLEQYQSQNQNANINTPNINPFATNFLQSSKFQHKRSIPSACSRGQQSNGAIGQSHNLPTD